MRIKCLSFISFLWQVSFIFLCNKFKWCYRTLCFKINLWIAYCVWSTRFIWTGDSFVWTFIINVRSHYIWIGITASLTTNLIPVKGWLEYRILFPYIRAHSFVWIIFLTVIICIIFGPGINPIICENTIMETTSFSTFPEMPKQNLLVRVTFCSDINRNKWLSLVLHLKLVNSLHVYRG